MTRGGNHTEIDGNLGERYEILAQVLGSTSGLKTHVGSSGVCRYCGDSNPSAFKTEAHLIPEALGNKWIFSDDECDECNQKFSVYESALAEAISPLLTLGGTRGKSAVRKTGRSAGPAQIRHERTPDGRRRIMARATVDKLDGVISAGSTLDMSLPVAGSRFRPRHAYKALSKIGYALLPTHEISHYSRLRAWLLDMDDQEDFQSLEVALSFGSVGNAPPLVSASLLRRRNPTDPIPNILMVLCAGSVCAQIDLMSDTLEDHMPPVPAGSIKLRWTTYLSNDDGSDQIAIRYSAPYHLNWTSTDLRPPPVDRVILSFEPETNSATFTPIFRSPQF